MASIHVHLLSHYHTVTWVMGPSCALIWRLKWRTICFQAHSKLLEDFFFFQYYQIQALRPSKSPLFEAFSTGCVQHGWLLLHSWMETLSGSSVWRQSLAQQNTIRGRHILSPLHILSFREGHWFHLLSRKGSLTRVRIAVTFGCLP